MSAIGNPTQVALPHEIFRELGAQALMAALAEQVGFPMLVKPFDQDALARAVFDVCRPSTVVPIRRGGAPWRVRPP